MTAESETQQLVELGQRALAQAAWEEARARFEEALSLELVPEALEGAAWAAWGLDDAQALFALRERAYRVYRERDDARAAARVATWVSSDYLDFRGDAAIANGWRQRARRLLRGLEPSVEHGWLALLEGAYAIEWAGDIGTARAVAREAAELGRQLGALDIELLGLAMEGLALVSEGQVVEGMRCLDEATAAAVGGEFTELVAAGWACCYLIFACEQVRDFDRAAQWCVRLEEMSKRFHSQQLFGVCRAHHAAVLAWRGAWSEAEQELIEASEVLGRARPALAAEAVARLAELRRHQGRPDEAAALFAEVAEHPLAGLGLAALALDSGDAHRALELIARERRKLAPQHRAGQIAPLELAVRAHLDLGEIAEAEAALRELAELTETIDSPPLRASTTLAAGLVHLARGELQEARQACEDAIDLFQRSGARFDAACGRLELARVLLAAGRLEAGRREAEAALAAFEEFGARAEGERARELVSEARAQPDRTTPRETAVLTSRELEVLRLVAAGAGDKEVAARLSISEHTVHRHMSNVLGKLGLPSRAAAVAQAARQGLL